MRKKNFKGHCEKRVIAKCSEIYRTYDAIQYAYVDVLQTSDEVKEIKCNVPLDGRDISEYTSDFVCVKTDNDLMVRECVFCKLLMKPLTVKMRSKIICSISTDRNISKQTIRNYLCLYLTYMDITVLAPKKRLDDDVKLTQDEKNIRWALNKFSAPRKSNLL